jgi:hypothetical protein
MSKEYLYYIRENSAYPTFRGFLNVLGGLGILIAVLIAFSGILIDSHLIIPGIVVGILIFIFNKIVIEVSTMVADTADATVHRGSLNWTQPIEKNMVPIDGVVDGKSENKNQNDDEILLHRINENKSNPDDMLIEKLSEWSCDRESPEFMAQLNGLNENLRAQIHQHYMQKNIAKWHVFKARLDAYPEEDRTAELRRQIRKEVGQLGI